jgi:DNA repair ATPase RecN
MADSKIIMTRLARVERDSAEFKKMLGQIAHILSDQSERIDHVGERIDQLGERVDQLGDRLGERLDRLIAVTIQERTYSVERLADIERRLTRLEKERPRST